MIFATFGASLLAAVLVAIFLIPRLHKAGITGSDVHKLGKPPVAEMGGFAIVAGMGVGLAVALAMMSFFHVLQDASMILLLASLAVILLTALIGIIDDLLSMPQCVKAFLPALAALPLVAVRAGQTTLVIPLVGTVDFWIFYPLCLVPVGVMVAANAANMLAGFNGLEAGVGLVAIGSLAVIAAVMNETTALIILATGAGAIFGVLLFNWYPARVLIGDVGTLTIGALMATAVIVGDFEAAGVIVLIPYAIDFFLKAAHRFPTSASQWAGELHEDGKLYCPSHGPVSLPQLIMRIAGGIHCRMLVIALMGVEAIFGVAAIALYVLH